MNDYFKQKMMEVAEDAEQLRAYNSTDSTVVIAGPGSGKTTVLTLKVMRLLDDVIAEPRGLACLTYSTESVREFKIRLSKLGLRRRSNVFLGTVHSFCLAEILTPFAKLYPKYEIPDPMEKDSFPNYYDTTQRRIDEARRLCFVAVSRARKACVLLRSKQLPNKYGKWFPKESSPFWTTLKEFHDAQALDEYGQQAD